MSGRAALEPATCPCGGSVDINPSWGGNRGQQTFYEVRCRKCGRVMDDYGTDGTKRSAIRQWNKERAK